LQVFAPTTIIIVVRFRNPIQITPFLHAHKVVNEAREGSSRDSSLQPSQ
jgi:hypothetical protein